MANIQLSACIPNFLILESIQDFGGFHGELLTRKIEWQDGYVIPSREPGLGIEFNAELARATPYDGDELHLIMAPEELTP